LAQGPEARGAQLSFVDTPFVGLVVGCRDDCLGRILEKASRA